MNNKINSPIGDHWEDLRKEIFTPEEMKKTDTKVALVGKLIEARHKQGLTQKKLEELSGVRQPIIARMERGETDPRLSTITKVLVPLGYTLAIVPIEKR